MGHDTWIRKLGADSAYLVEESLVVGHDVTLVIEPGVKAYFTQQATLTITGGNLIAQGLPDDSISFFCEELSKDWPGIRLKNITPNHTILCSYVDISGASTAISMSNAENVSIEHCSFHNVFGRDGIVLNDCVNCTVSNCYFQYLIGITLCTSENNSVHNILSSNIFSSGQINIYVTNSGGGWSCYDNYITDNCFQGGSTALYFEAAQNFSQRNHKNYILNNLISSSIPTGSPGYHSYGIKTSLDSLIIQNNIFWDNDEAINCLKGVYINIENNTFYKNKSVLTNLMPGGSVVLKGNVLSELQDEVASFTDNQVEISHNNILNYDDSIVLFRNACASSISLKENYWQCHDLDSINAMVYDEGEDPQLGPIDVSDFLTRADTAVPIAPPYRVTKQYHDGAWHIEWEPNEETDLSHYVLFYGDFSQYRFSNHIDSIFDNSYILENQNVDNVAIVACDGACNFDKYSIPSKSAYAFAEYLPFAGHDASLCNDTDGYLLSESNIPFAYSIVWWTTSGTGSFSDSHNLHPTYYPSEDDYDAGGVYLTVNVNFMSSLRSDHLWLELHRFPEVDAGHDYYGGMGRPVEVNGAQVSYYHSLLWSSLGDGSFDDNTRIDPVYYLGPGDLQLGRVTMVLQAWSSCGMSSDTVTYALFDEFSMQGRVWLNGIPYPKAQVIAVSMDEDNPFFNGFYRTATDEEGFFNLDIIGGDYILYALPDTTDASTAGAYFWKRFSWDDAERIHANGNVYDVDIYLSPTLTDMPAGTASIKGSFEMPTTQFRAMDFYCQSWFESSSSSSCENGLSNISILLMDADHRHVVDFAMTDAQGRFSFDDLPFGTYCLVSDVPRYGKALHTTIELNPDNPSLDDVVLYIDNHGDVSLRLTNEDVIDVEFPMVYPVPVDDVLFVTGLDKFERYVIYILDQMGVIRKYETALSDEYGGFNLDVAHLHKSVYTLVVENSVSQHVFKFVK